MVGVNNRNLGSFVTDVETVSYTHLLRTVDALIVAGHPLELVRQGDFVVAVEAVDHGKVNAEFIEYVGV